MVTVGNEMKLFGAHVVDSPHCFNGGSVFQCIGYTNNSFQTELLVFGIRWSVLEDISHCELKKLDDIRVHVKCKIIMLRGAALPFAASTP